MAQIRLRDTGGTLRTITRIRVRDAEGELRDIQRVRVRDASAVLRTVYQAAVPIATASPSSVSGTGSTSIIDSASSTVSVAGGSSPFTYAWELIPGGDAFVILGASTATATFRKVGTSAGNTYFTLAQCVVTDAAGNTFTSNIVDVTITRT